MSIDSSSRLGLVFVFHQVTDGVLSNPYLHARLTGIDTVGIFNQTRIDGDSASDLEDIQDLYASSAGLQDEDDNAYTVQLRYFPTAISDETELEDHGYPNPLVEGSYERWLASKKVQGYFLQGSTVETDADTSAQTLDLKAHVGTSRRVPEGGTYDAALDDWNVRPVDGDEFELLLSIDPELGYTATNISDTANSEAIRDLSAMRAMSAFIDSLTSHDLADDLITHRIPTSYLNRNYEWDQASGNTITFQITNASPFNLYRDFNHESVVIALRIHCTVQSNSANDYDEDLMQAYLDSQTVETLVDGQELQPTEMGTPASHGRFGRLYLGSSGSYLTRRQRWEHSRHTC